MNGLDLTRHLCIFFLLLLLKGCMSSTLQPISGKELLDHREKRTSELIEQGRLADALLQIRILMTLAPANRTYAEKYAQVKAQVKTQAKSHVQQGDMARKRGGISKAKHHYLCALALDPGLSSPIKYLRAIEKDRILHVQDRSIQRVIAAREDKAKKKNTEIEEKPGGGDKEQPEESYYLHLGIKFFKEGRLQDCIYEIQKYLNIYPNDPEAVRYMSTAHFKLGRDFYLKGQLNEALVHFEQVGTAQEGADRIEVDDYMVRIRKELAEKYYRKGMEVYRQDPGKAIAHWQRCLTYDPQHVKAGIQLRKTRSILKSLEKIETRERAEKGRLP